MTKPTVTVRVDCNARVGYGHVMRCLAVSRHLIEDSVKVRFVMSADSDAAPIESLGLQITRLNNSDAGIESLADALSPSDGPLLLDSYEIGTAGLGILHEAGFRIAMFDDGKRLDDYPCNLVIDSAPGASNLDYRGLANSRFCLGSDYVPLRDEFTKMPPRTGMPEDARRIVVTFGGSDHDDQSARTIEALSGLNDNWQIDVILGPAYCGRAETVGAENSAVHLHRNVMDMATLMSRSHMAIASSGGTALELACLGVPMILLGLSEDQVPVATALAAAGAAEYLGFWSTVDDTDIGDRAQSLSINNESRRRMSACGKALVDGLGAKRIATEILNIWSDRPIIAEQETIAPDTRTA
ncbi:MAG: UDP-2,4-diacetamido-2,4,6-trideoxy-beta-L-altropyranose hydrolase [Rhodospirillaceae bacterium]|jgi:UDP-2,4-diacetamido-2,4,6-trideoxy-beta-L-altropyranose hydrolase|nr:UDP-2,4-diacetamido-2,4,6-trideoxy-beta-L-altropyranose hydrolase [Rhodospirillaceae bacterium]MBT5242920.1 UDP-2,4-diacetamido-2,4,6-trideoxy-beta-L-altropyranose hydrolase [Rhodospirillaceae bacterium]MBT5563144.1 UDP-2,4-diacetamido-2,4,6-trideoxy-beta-L-altropyranose hydrolase [Rhodospirillaceae bacterium]MBT6243459.1 UDP-2,4-diacetamido-2,4,6-trideoxy-beta-L-altropyranose hydrolase [Rhodospirillaceae bacterium]MBT7138305.1 UDP-2,4-diacetamido-2,4,6-trideoxy-beta-L-altropyranose hydrolas